MAMHGKQPTIIDEVEKMPHHLSLGVSMESKIKSRGAFHEIRRILEDLQGDLLFILMASDKELFHSNVHARLFLSNPRFKKAFFEKFSSKNENQKKNQVTREYKKIDLYMNYPGFNTLAIENKLFADLGDNQLDRYTNQLKKSKKRWHGVLLTLNALNMESLSIAARESWQVITYGEFAEFLEKHINLLEVDEFEREFFFRYLKLIKQLAELMTILLPESDDPHLEISLDIPGSIQVSINKMRYRLITEEIRLLIQPSFASTAYELGYGITHTKPFLELQFKLMNGDYLGWQYQESQFRLFAKCNNLSGKGLHDERVKFALDQYRDWFDFSQINQFLGPVTVIRPEEEGKLLKFDPNFVYKYAKTSELTIENLVEISKLLQIVTQARDLT